MESLPIVLRICLWLGILSLYFGFAGVLGVLARRAARAGATRADGALVAAHAGLLFIPASVLVLSLAEWPLFLRTALFLAALALVGLAAAQPAWLPSRFWQRPFGHRYFAGAMGLAALWGVGLAFTAQALVPVIVGAAATFAGAASLYTTPQPDVRFGEARGLE